MHLAGERATAQSPQPMVAPGKVLARHRRLILVATILGALAGATYVVTVPRRYESTAALRFRTPAELGAATGVTAVERLVPKGIAIAGANRVKTGETIRDGARRFGHVTPEALRDAITVRLDTATNEVDVIGRARRPHRAARLAAAMAAAVVAQEARHVRDGLREPLRSAMRRLQAAPAGAAGSATRTAVSDELARLRSYALFARPVDLVGPATIPTSPVRPRPFFDVLLGAFAGLACGLFAAFCTALGNTRTRRRPSPAYAVAVGRDLPMREIAAAIAIGLEDGTPTVVGVFGSWRGAGRTTAALELADELAARGRRVALVEADLRAPSLGRRLQLDDGPGLADVLAAAAAIDAVLRPLARQRRGEVDCLPAGGHTPAPDALLASPRLGELLAELTAGHDFVVVDTAAAELASDALELLPLVDVRIVCTGDGGPQAGGALERALAGCTRGATLVIGARHGGRVRRARECWPRRATVTRAA